MKVDTEVIYYDSQQRKHYKDLVELWKQKAKVGKVQEVKKVVS